MKPMEDDNRSYASPSLPLFDILNNGKERMSVRTKHWDPGLLALEQENFHICGKSEK